MNRSFQEVIQFSIFSQNVQTFDWNTTSEMFHCAAKSLMSLKIQAKLHHCHPYIWLEE